MYNFHTRHKTVSKWQHILYCLIDPKLWNYSELRIYWLIPLGTVDNNVEPDRLMGPKTLTSQLLRTTNPLITQLLFAGSNLTRQRLNWVIAVVLQLAIFLSLLLKIHLSYYLRHSVIVNYSTIKFNKAVTKFTDFVTKYIHLKIVPITFIFENRMWCNLVRAWDRAVDREV